MVQDSTVGRLIREIEKMNLLLERLVVAIEKSPIMRVEKVESGNERPDYERPEFDTERSDSDLEKSESDLKVAVGDHAVVRRAHGNWSLGDQVEITHVGQYGDDTVMAKGFSMNEQTHIQDWIDPTCLERVDSTSGEEEQV